MGAAILLTGAPGSGKTTAIQRIIAALDCPLVGFYTREMRQSGVRHGFELVTLDGVRGVLAHVDHRSSQRVGRYGVDLSVLEDLGLGAIRSAASVHQLVVIDEIGPMEILSFAFRQAVLDLLAGDTPLLGAIARKENPFIREVKSHPGVHLLTIRRDKREAVVAQALSLLGELGLPLRPS